MNLFGEIVTPQQIAACEIRMKAGQFARSDITAVASAHGVAHATELAFRLHGRNRANLREISRRQWVWYDALSFGPESDYSI